ncbi:MAG TPA: V-type ATP synthase subunit I [Lachnospiraceae bacterium]|nr:V-type ATP synthase subunit I [Lachnospiraceae bacterium]
MSVLQMQRISICAMKKDRKAILEDLQSLGVLEIDTSAVQDEELMRMDTLESRQAFEKNANAADQALEVLDEYSPEKKSMFASLEGKELIERANYLNVAERRDEILRKTNQIMALKKAIAESKAGIVKLETQKESLTPWLALDVPLNYRGTKRTAVLIGSIGSVLPLEELYQKIAEHVPDLDAVDLQIISVDKDQTCVAVICLKENAAALEEALRTLGFARPSQNVSEVPARQLEKLDAEIAELRQKIARTEDEIRTFADRREELRVFSDYFRIRAQKYEVLSRIPQSGRTFFITGYVPKKKAKGLEDKLEQKYSLSVELEEVSEEEDVPVLLENGKLAGTMEGIVASFGLPGKGEFDPSKVMFFFYIFLFGLMLSDAAYGFIIFLACAIVLKKFPRMAENMQKSIRMFMYCGLSTMVWGILLGGYFGDAINVISRTFFGHEVGLDPVWFAPLDDPMKLLIYSMLFGVIHLYTGLILKGYMCVRDKRYVDLICDVVFWLMMLTGLIMMLLPSELFRSISQMNIVFPAAVNTLAKVLAIGGAVGILLMSGRANKNPLLRIALGAYDLYNVTGWLSDVLSYSRLLALGLATGVIASVINQMGSMLGGGIVGVILFIVVFIIGHVFNLAINVLGAYVHTCRLQYVEFFGKFYEGGGREFNPFKENTKYVDIKEDTRL